MPWNYRETLDNLLDREPPPLKSQNVPENGPKTWATHRCRKDQQNITCTPILYDLGCLHVHREIPFVRLAARGWEFPMVAGSVKLRPRRAGGPPFVG